MIRSASLLLTILLVAPATFAAAAQRAIPAAVRKDLSRFNPVAMRAHTRFLSSDLLEGRGPGTRGDQLAQAYVAAQFEALGLKPAGDNGTYIQHVPMIGITTKAGATSVEFVGPTGSVTPKLLDDMVVTNDAQQSRSAIDADLVFVGHGVIAPEYRWDDYKGADLKGKVLVMLVDDPPATAAEPALFGGVARTYYGRWTYKYEEALRQGAVGAILVHTNAAAGYGWNVIRGSWGRENATMKLKQGEHALQMSSWVTEPVARQIFALAGKDLVSLTSAANSRDFRPVPLGVKIRATIESDIREIDTANVLAMLPGADPKLASEAVLYTAHLDHLGIGTPKNGDAIYNGAVDNATGVAVLLDLARVWSQSSSRPRRSIIFAAVTAEEAGLRGSQYYAEHPFIPAGKTAIDLNFDGIQPLGRSRNVSLLGLERTDFLPVATRVAAALGLRIDPDEHPDQGSFYRSDHFSLARVGVPAVSVKLGSEYIGKTRDWGRQKYEEYEKSRYHQPSDQFDESWDFSALAQMGELVYWLGREAANSTTLPRWNKGDEFAPVRDASIAASSGR